MTSATDKPVVRTREIFNRISANGIRVDVSGLREQLAVWEQNEAELLAELNVTFGYTELRAAKPAAFSKKDTGFNPRSAKHLTAWLETKGIDPPKSFAESVLEEVFPQDKATAIMEARRARIHMSALAGLLSRSVNGRVHPDWVEAETGRWYAKEPQVQTMSRVVREFLVPDEGNSFYVLDWKQQELRILAHCSQDPILQAIFDDVDRDPHVETYERVVRRKMDPEPGPRRDRQRDVGKMLNYALIYGLDARGLGARLRIPNADAQVLLDAYFRAYPVLNEWRETQKVLARQDGGITTLGGRFIPIQKETDRRDAEARIDRKAVNYYVQGSAADQLEILLKRIHEHGALKEDRNMIDLIRCTIHDALLTECTATATKWFKKIMEMPSIGMPAVPVDVKGPSPNWLAAMAWIEPELEEHPS